MNQQHRYAYDKSFPGHLAKKYKCPQCGHKRYVQFYDFETNTYLPEHFGKCDREDTCGYVSTPWEWLKETKGQSDAQNYRVAVNYAEPPPAARIIEIEKSILKQTLQHYERNNFFMYLLAIFEVHTVYDLMAKYFVGTAKGNGTIFWQVDQLYRIRTAQKIHYKPDGHRDKSINPPSQRLFTIDKGYIPCLFGEHLIYDAPRNATFAICEAEKTAIICSVYYPTYEGKPLVWLACCGMHGFTPEKLDALTGQDILLCPDFAFSARATWGSEVMRKKKNEATGKLEINPEGEIDADYISIKQRLIERGCKVSFFDPYPDVKDGSDLADYCVKERSPSLYEVPDYDSLGLKNPGGERGNPEKDIQKLDFLAIGQAIEERDSKPVASIKERASKLIYQRYGYGVAQGKFDELAPKVEGQLKIIEHPGVQKLIKVFNLDTSLKF